MLELLLGRHEIPERRRPDRQQGCANVTVRRVRSIGASDSAFDLLKGAKNRLEDVTGKDAARCIKSGAVKVAGTTEACIGTRTAIELHGNNLTVHTLTYDSDTRTAKSWLFSAVAGLAGKATLTVKRCVSPTGGPIRLPTREWLAKEKSVSVNLRRSCLMPDKKLAR